MNMLTGYNGMGCGLPGVRAALLVAIGCCAVANVALAVDPKLADEVESANQLYVDGDYQAALDAYAKAQTDCPECAELAYNQGLTHYRLGDLSEARELFNEALSTNDTKLEAKAKYNLGNVAYSEALANQAEPQKAIQSVQSAIDFYRDALELSPNDRDARANIETANRFLKELQQQQQQNQDQQQQDQQKDQDQEQDQQKQDQQEQENNDQQNDEQNSDQDQNNQQDKQQNEQDQQQQDEQSKEGESEQQQDQEQQDDQQKQGGEQDQQQADSTDQQGQSKQQPNEAQELTEEEAERLLQAVRDKEAKRRAQLAERRKAQRMTVDKDW